MASFAFIQFKLTFFVQPEHIKLLNTSLQMLGFFFKASKYGTS